MGRTGPIRSVADQMRMQERAAVRRLSATRRVALALALGARDLELFCAGLEPPVTREEAARRLDRRRQAGRRPSACAAPPDQ